MTCLLQLRKIKLGGRKAVAYRDYKKKRAHRQLILIYFLYTALFLRSTPAGAAADDDHDEVCVGVITPVTPPLPTVAVGTVFFTLAQTQPLMCIDAAPEPPPGER